MAVCAPCGPCCTCSVPNVTYTASSTQNATGAWGWGVNGVGQLGDGTMSTRFLPANTGFAGAATWTSVVSGWQHTCALTADTGVVCWGYNSHGQLGTGNTINALVPTPINGVTAGLEGWTMLGLGDYHTCGLKANGGIWCMGHNGQGALGTGGGDTSSPTEVADPGPFTFMTAARRYTCATKAEGTAWCWGWNDRQVVGSTPTGSLFAPTPVYWWSATGAPTVFFSIYASKGDSHFTCALDNSTQAYCWVRILCRCR